MIDELLKLSNEEILEKVKKKYDLGKGHWNVSKHEAIKKIVISNVNGDVVYVDKFGMISSNHEPIYLFDQYFKWE